MRRKFFYRLISLVSKQAINLNITLAKIKGIKGVINNVIYHINKLKKDKIYTVITIDAQ